MRIINLKAEIDQIIKQYFQNVNPELILMKISKNRYLCTFRLVEYPMSQPETNDFTLKNPLDLSIIVVNCTSIYKKLTF